MFVEVPIVVELVVFILYVADSTNLQVPLAIQVLPTGIVDVDAMDGNDPLLIEALNNAPVASSGATTPVILLNSLYYAFDFSS
jgi:hypothetical protein